VVMTPAFADVRVAGSWTSFLPWGVELMKTPVATR